MSRQRARWVLVMMITIFVVLLGQFSVRRFESFKAHVHDLGLIAQTLESTREGRWFANSINPSIGRSESYLGNHFSPGLLLFLPLYALVPSPRALLWVQAALLGLAAWPAYRLARRRFDRGLSLALTGALLLHPALWSVGLYDFHHETVSVPMVLLAWLLLESGRARSALAVMAVLVTMKEHLPLLACAFSLYMALDPRYRRLGLGAALVFLAWFGLVLGVFMPAFNAGEGHGYFASRFPHLGSSAREAVLTILGRPDVPLAHMATARHGYYLYGLLAPLLYLPLLAPVVLLVALPTFFINAQSLIPISYDIGFYHSDSILPVLFVAARDGIGRFRAAFPVVTRRLERARVGMGTVLLAAAAFGHATIESGFLPGHRAPLSPWAVHADYRVTDHHRRIEEIRRLVPRKASLSVQANLACFFVDHPVLHPFPVGLEEDEWVLLDLTRPYAHRRDFHRFWVEWSFQATTSDYCDALADLLADGRREVAEFRDGYLLMRRTTAPAPPHPRELLDRSHAYCAALTALEGRGYGVSHRGTRTPGPVPPGPVPDGPGATSRRSGSWTAR